MKNSIFKLFNKSYQKKIFIFHLIIILLFNNQYVNGSMASDKPSLQHDSLCLVENTEYPDEYLNMFGDKDSRENFIRKAFISTITSPSGVNKQVDQPSNYWIFQPLNAVSSAYLIRNQKYNEYLCSSEKRQGLFGTRRVVSGKEMITENDRSCMWKLEQLDRHLDTNIYHIFNVQYGEPLYTASNIFQSAGSKRPVYTYHKEPNSKQFVWNIFCQSSNEYY